MTHLPVLIAESGARALAHVEKLAAIGSRQIGTPGNLAAADYIYTALAATGLKVHRQTFPCPLWTADRAELTAGEESLPAAANPFSPTCDCTAPMVAAGTLAELERTDLHGKIALLHGQLTVDEGFGYRHAAYFPEHHQRLVQLLEEKRPEAVLTVDLKPGRRERLIRDWELELPSATVTIETGLALLRQPDRMLHLRIDGRRQPAEFCNILAHKPGKGTGRLLVMAHFDTQSDTPGALDNGSGVGALLALAERLAGWENTLELSFMAVNGEECGGVGGAHYLRECSALLPELLTVINMDGIGPAVGVSTVTAMGGSEAFEQTVRAVHARYPEIGWNEPWYASDHSGFLWCGVPAIALTSAGPLEIVHYPHDTPVWLGAQPLGEVVALVSELVQALQDKTPAWSRAPQG